MHSQLIDPREKFTEIVEFIGDECIVIMFLTETWMGISYDDEAKCADLTGYSFRSFRRATRGGGLAVLLTVTITTSFPFVHTSFDLIQVTLTVPDHVHFFWLCRPPPPSPPPPPPPPHHP